MSYLSHLLQRDRAPFCPINGMLQAAPLAWSQREQDVVRLSPAAADDMKVLHRQLRLQFPVVFMLSGLHELDGFSDLVERCGQLDTRFRDSRAGSRYPTGAALGEATSQWTIQRALNFFRGWIYSGFSQDLNNPNNRRLYRLLGELNTRSARFVAQLRQTFEGVSDVDDPPVRLGGCYFAATGDGSGRQGFVKGVLLKLVSEQGEVAWTPRAIRRDRRSRALAWTLFTASGMLAVGNCLLVWVLSNGTGGLGL